MSGSGYGRRMTDAEQTSMISALIDELNKSADEWNNSNMFELARMCREAADTITELRGALQVASVDYRHLSEENAKLRELLAEMYPCAKAYIQEWLMVGGIDSKSYDWYLRLRELGMEVDE